MNPKARYILSHFQLEILPKCLFATKLEAVKDLRILVLTVYLHMSQPSPKKIDLPKVTLVRRKIINYTPSFSHCKMTANYTPSGPLECNICLQK